MKTPRGFAGELAKPFFGCTHYIYQISMGQKFNMRFIVILFVLFFQHSYLYSQTKDDVIDCLEIVFKQPEMETVIQKMQLISNIIILERKFEIGFNPLPEELIRTQFEKDDFWGIPIEFDLLTQKEINDLDINPHRILHLNFDFDQKKRILIMLHTTLEDRPRFFNGQFFFEQKQGNWALINQTHSYR